MNTPNSVEESFDAAGVRTAPTAEEIANGTVVAPDAEQVVDYEKKFSASSKEALRLLEENKVKDAEIERLRALSETAPDRGNASESLYPGFDQLDEEEQARVASFAQTIERGVREGLKNDPAISFAHRQYNENKFGTALTSVIEKYPDLASSKDEFKEKFFSADNVPDNIEEILVDLAKVHLFDRAHEAGVQEGKDLAERLDTERVRGGANGAPTQTSRSLAEWQHIAISNPVKFASMKKEYEADLATGKLVE